MVIRRFAVSLGLILCAWQLSHMAFRSVPALVPTASAQDSDFTLEGKITEKSGNKLTVSTGENIIFHVVFNDKTEIRKKDGSPGTAQDLHTGLKISVAGSLADSGEITAKTINIEGEGGGNQ